MKNYITKLIIIGVLLALISSCNSDSNSIGMKALDFKDFKVTTRKIENFSEIGRITRVVKLETTGDSILGMINTAVVDKTNGDLIIGDFFSSKKVVRFDSAGKPLFSYGRAGRGPGEYDHIVDFAVDSVGNLFMLTHTKLVYYLKNGSLADEKRLDVSAKDIEIIGDSIYLSVTAFRRNSDNKKAVVVLNKDLSEINRFGEYDTRLTKYRFMGMNTFASESGRLYYIENYDLKLTYFNTATQISHVLEIPNNNSALDGVWQKSRLDEDDREKIRSSSHRFAMIRSIGSRFFLAEFCRDKDIFDCWVLDLNNKTVTKFPYEIMVGSTENRLGFNMIAGSNDNELITVFSDAEAFNRFKTGYAMLKDMEFEIDDNPIIAFFEFRLN